MRAISGRFLKASISIRRRAAQTHKTRRTAFDPFGTGCEGAQCDIDIPFSDNEASLGLRALIDGFRDVDEGALDAANSLAMLLRLQGHEVQVASSGPAALDVVFMDIGMPGMDGYEVARRMREYFGLKIVVLVALTGWGQQVDRRRTAEAGFNHHLVKPPEPKAVEGILAALPRRQSSEEPEA